MSNAVQVFQQNSGLVLSSKFAALADEIGGDLEGGVSGSYAILSIKGSRFSVKFKGDMTPIVNPETGDPVGSLELVLVKANDYLTKQYYAKGYVEGDSAAPDCFSIDGKAPSASSPMIQHSNCATCPQNTFSKINESTGKKTKPCQDNRKIAVLPTGDLKNEMFGGPMLLRVPAASLGDVATFGSTMKQAGYPYNAVSVRVSFDLTVSYPKLVLKAVRPLTDDEADVVLEWYKSDAVDKMLADFSDIAVAPPAAGAPAPASVFEQPPQQAATAPAPKPAPAAPKAPPAQPQAAKPAGVSFGAPAKPAAPAAPAAPKAPAPQKAKAAAKPAAPVAPAAPVQMPLPVEAQSGDANEDVDTTTEQVPGNLESDIAGILDELNSIAQ